MNPVQTYFSNNKSYIYVNNITKLNMSLTTEGINSKNPLLIDTGSEGVIKFNNGSVNFTYQQPYTGIIKIYSKNKARFINGISIAENAGGDAGVTHRYTYDAKSIRSFKGLERLIINQYYYQQLIKGANKITGDFGKYFNKTIKEFQLNVELPTEDANAVINFNDLDKNIALEIFYIGYSGMTEVINNFGTIKGNLRNLPYKLKELYINTRAQTLFDSDGNDLSDIKIPLEKLQINGSNIKGNISDLPDTIDTLWLLGNNYNLSGNTNSVFKVNMKSMYIRGGISTSTFIVDMSTLGNTMPNLTYLNLNVTNRKVTIGNINNLPKDISSLNITNSDVSGDVNNLPKNTYSIISVTTGDNTINGEVKNIPKSDTIQIYGQNTITGDIALNPYTYNIFNIQGQNTITGNIFNKKVGNQLSIQGQNTVSGEPSGLDSYHSITLYGNNTVTGNIAKYKATNSIQITGQNTISGNINDYSTASSIIVITGQNTITGDLGKLSSSIYIMDIRGNNTINKYTKGKRWPNLVRLELHGKANLSSSDVDDLLIDISNTITTTSVGYIIIKGLCQPRTSRSDQAVLKLETEFKKIVTTN